MSKKTLTTEELAELRNEAAKVFPKDGPEPTVILRHEMFQRMVSMLTPAPLAPELAEAENGCPFCGSHRARLVGVEIKYERDRYYRVKCDECGAYGPAVSAYQSNYSLNGVEALKAKAQNLWKNRTLLRHARAQQPNTDTHSADDVKKAKALLTDFGWSCGQGDSDLWTSAEYASWMRKLVGAMSERIEAMSRAQQPGLEK